MRIRYLLVAALCATSMAACSGPATAPVTGAAQAGSKQIIAPITPDRSVNPVAQPKPAATPAASPTARVTRIKYSFPVVGKNSYARSHHDYPASDIMTKCGNRFVAVTSGVVLAVSRKDTWKRKVNAGATRGGLSVSILGDDGVRYYGSHLKVVGQLIKPGVRVKSGQTLALTGDTGDASACHLHFGISPPCAKTGDWWNQRGTVWPWSFLDSWKKGGQKSAVATVKAWQKSHGCPKKPTVNP